MTTFDLKLYSGSGVLIVDTKSSSLLLVNDYTQNYNCCGGFIKYNSDDRQRLEKTASEELYEETRTLISCDLDCLTTCPFVDLHFNGEMFRCYILKIRCESDICQQFENFNLDSLPPDNDYLETSSLAFFHLKQFKRKKSFIKIDATNVAIGTDRKKYPLNQRVISVIKEAVKEKLL
jgi:hypothetical protein